MSYYAVSIGRTTGIFTSWADCKAQVEGFSGARYKQFSSADEAQIFIENTGSSNYRPLKKTANNSYNGKNNPKRQHSKLSFQYKASDQYEEDSNSSDDGEDLSTILTKQMDDIEKRLRSFEKRINEIYNKNASKSSGKAILVKTPQKRNRTDSHLKFGKDDDDGFTIVNTDGACSSNGQHKVRVD